MLWKKHETWGNPDLINIQSSPSTVGIKVIFLVCIGRNQSSPCHGKIGSVRIKPTSEKHKEPRWGRRSSLRVRWKMIKCHLIISKRDDVTEVSLKWESWRHADLMYVVAGPWAPPISSEPSCWLPAANLCPSMAEGSFHPDWSCPAWGQDRLAVPVN